MHAAVGNDVSIRDARMGFFKRYPLAAVTFAVVVLTVVIVAIRWQAARETALPDRVRVAADAIDAPQPAAAQRAAVPEPAPSKAVSPAPPASWRQASGRMEDVLASLPSAVADALGGDPAARYHLARTLMVCQLAGNAGRTGPEETWAACRDILASPALAQLSGPNGAGGVAGWAPLLADAVQAGDKRAYGYAALYCGSGSPCDPTSGDDRLMSLAAAQTRAGIAIRSGDPEAIFHAGLAIGNARLGRNPLRGAAWMLVACERGYDCSAENELNQELICPRGAPDCIPGSSLRDRLQAKLGPATYAEAYALAQRYQQDLDSGEVPERAIAFGSK